MSNTQVKHVGHRLYARYLAMRGRTMSPSHPAFKNYGGRGITICPEWREVRHGFKRYAAYVEALPNAFKEGYSLDRINNDGNYEPGNLRWASNSIQVINRRKKSKMYKEVERLVEEYCENLRDVNKITEQIVKLMRPIPVVTKREQRMCTNCFEIKTITEFQKDIKCIGGYRFRCKACVAAMSKKAYERKNQ